MTAYGPGFDYRQLHRSVYSFPAQKEEMMYEFARRFPEEARRFAVSYTYRPASGLPDCNGPHNTVCPRAISSDDLGNFALTCPVGALMRFVTGNLSWSQPIPEEVTDFFYESEQVPPGVRLEEGDTLYDYPFHESLSEFMVDWDCGVVSNLPVAFGLSGGG